MKWMTDKRWVRKAFLLAFLAVASILAAEVFRLLDRKTPEELLTMLRAERVFATTLEVNGRTLTADVWQLPPTSSADPLRKAVGRCVAVGRTVYVFRDGDLPKKGDCAWPKDFPDVGVRPDYVVVSGLDRFANGVTAQTPEAVLAALATAAPAAGWSQTLPQVWEKDGETLFAQVAESRRGTEVALIARRTPQ